MFSNPTAFDPFYDETACIAGTRRESGASASRALSLTVPCCVIEGDPAQSHNPGAPTLEREYTVLIRRADWADHLPPQTGDTVTVSGRPLMRVVRPSPLGDDWSVACRSKETAN